MSDRVRPRILKEKAGEEQEETRLDVMRKAAAMSSGQPGTGFPESDARERLHRLSGGYFEQGNGASLFELELERLAKQGIYVLSVQPGCGAGLTDEGDGTTHPKRGVEGLEVEGETGQSVE